MKLGLALGVLVNVGVEVAEPAGVAVATGVVGNFITVRRLEVAPSWKATYGTPPPTAIDRIWAVPELKLALPTTDQLPL